MRDRFNAARSGLSSVAVFGRRFMLTVASRPQSCETFVSNTVPDERRHSR